jgi:hypothetical protein
MTTEHPMTVTIPVHYDDFEIIDRAAELALEEVQKQATWYGAIRDQLESIKVDEARDMIRERIALVLERGFTHIGESGYWLGYPERDPDAPPCGLNYKTGAGQEAYKMDSFEDWFRAVLVSEAQKMVGHYAQRIAAEEIEKLKAAGE